MNAKNPFQHVSEPIEKLMREVARQNAEWVDIRGGLEAFDGISAEIEVAPKPPTQTTCLGSGLRG